LTEYLFGDSDLAGHRLKILAEVYADSTKAFVIGHVRRKPRLFFDVGCGPGYTTHLIANVLGCEQAVGLDNSEHFISLAQKSATDSVSFQLHDVTKIPFPAGPADLLFCRFLMTHLLDPQAALSRWATQVVPKGLLLIEEVETIMTANPIFTEYLQIVDAMLKAQNRMLYIGPSLDSIHPPGSLKKVRSTLNQLVVPTHQAALMFYLNIQTWKRQPFVRTNYYSSSIENLEKAMGILSAAKKDEIEIQWTLRQMVFESR